MLDKNEDENPSCYGQLGCPLNDIEDLFSQVISSPTVTQTEIPSADLLNNQLLTASDLFSSMILPQQPIITPNMTTTLTTPAVPHIPLQPPIVYIPSLQTNDLNFLNQWTQMCNSMLLFPQFQTPSATFPLTPTSATSSSMDSAGSSPVPKKRKKVIQACTNCRKAHVSCSEERPCTRCTRKNITHLCVDAPASSKEKKIPPEVGKRIVLFPKCTSCPVKLRPADPLVKPVNKDGVLMIQETSCSHVVSSLQIKKEDELVDQVEIVEPKKKKRKEVDIENNKESDFALDRNLFGENFKKFIQQEQLEY